MSTRKSAVDMLETHADKLRVHNRAFVYHMTAWRADTAGVPSMVRGLAAFADKYFAEHAQNTLSNDYVIGEAWARAAQSIRDLLNADVTGNLDCGTVDALLCALLKNEGFEP